jgi:glycosyltransferase involved in cell wall biosynthesis
MRIGLDAKWFFNGPPSGRVVTRNHVKHLLKIDRSNEYYLFLDRRDKKEIFPYKGINIHLVYIWADNNLISNVFILPYYGRKLNLDVIIFQNFPGNSGHYASISFIHDTLFLSHPQYYTYCERLYFTPLRILSRKATRICTISNEEKKRLLRYGYKINENDIDVIYHGVSDAFKPIEYYSKDTLETIKRKYHLPDQYLLFVGRLNERKNIYHLINAIPSLNDKDILLVIVGEKDWKMFDLDRLIKKVGIKDRIVFTGPIYNDDLACVYAMAKIFCFPSYAEGFGLPPLEAMAAGVPIVVSNTTSLPEVCGDAGTYVNPNSAKEIASAINRLMENKLYYEQQCERGINQAAKFTWDAAAHRLLKTCESLSHK